MVFNWKQKVVIGILLALVLFVGWVIGGIYL